MTVLSCGLVGRREDIAACGKEHPMEVVALRLIPDPISEKRPVDEWHIRVRSDAGKECRATLRVVESGKTDGLSKDISGDLVTGLNQIVLLAGGEYRLTGESVCFDVTIVNDKAATPLPKARNFCAKFIDKSFWSMR